MSVSLECRKEVCVDGKGEVQCCDNDNVCDDSIGDLLTVAARMGGVREVLEATNSEDGQT